MSPLRKVILSILACSFLLLGIAGWYDRRSDLQFEITEVYPPLPAQIAWSKFLHVRLKYSSDRPVSFRLDGYVAGEKVAYGYGDFGYRYPAGNGEALAMLSFSRRPLTLDEIRIVALDRNRKPIGSISMSASVALLDIGKPVGLPKEPEWLVHLRTELVHNSGIQTQQDAYAPITFYLNFALVCVLIYLALQPLALFGLSGGYRAAGLVPVFFLLPASLIFRQSVFIFSPLAVAFLVVLLLSSKWDAPKPTSLTSK